MQKMYQHREEENKFPSLKMIVSKHKVKYQMPRKQVQRLTMSQEFTNLTKDTYCEVWTIINVF